MKRRSKILASIAGIIAAAVAFSGDGLKWRGRTFAQVASGTEIPQPIRAYLKMDDHGRRGVAEPGQPFETTDVDINGLPNRRLFAAGHSGTKWLVILDCGGYSRQFKAYLFDGVALEGQWILMWYRNATVASLVNNPGWEESR